MINSLTYVSYSTVVQYIREYGYLKLLLPKIISQNQLNIYFVTALNSFTEKYNQTSQLLLPIFKLYCKGMAGHVRMSPCYDK